MSLTVLHVKLGVFVKAWTVLAFLGIYGIFHEIAEAVAPKVTTGGSLQWFQAGVPLIGIVITWLFTKKKLQEIHVLVNSRLSKALEEISQLRTEISKRDPENVPKAVAAQIAAVDAKPLLSVPDVKK